MVCIPKGRKRSYPSGGDSPKRSKIPRVKQPKNLTHKAKLAKRTVTEAVMKEKDIETKIMHLEGILQQYKDKEPPKLKPNEALRVGTDCSGMGCDLIAMKALNLEDRCKPVFWCEVCPKKRALYEDVCQILGLPLPRLHEDITAREHRMLEDIDLYISGFPCKSMSSLGKRLGVKDPRGHIGFHCLEVAIVKRPAVSLFENVKGLLHKKHKRFTDFFKKCLKTCGYKVFMKVLNTKEHGVPQSRPRVYIVAIHEKVLRHKFKFPKSFKGSKKDLGQVLEREVKGDELIDISNYEQKHPGKNLWHRPLVLDVQSSKGFQHCHFHSAPCLTFSRLGHLKSGYYIPVLRRRLSNFEAGRLQGLPDNLLRKLIDRHEASNLGSALGDGMSINVLSKVILAALISIGFVPQNERDIRDRWKEQRSFWKGWNFESRQ